MQQGIRIVTAGAGIGFLLACSGVSMPISLGTTYDNVTPCQGYVDTYNAMACVPEHKRMDREDNCGRHLNSVPCDLSDHYACMSAGSACDGDEIDVSGQKVCGDRSCD